MKMMESIHNTSFKNNVMQEAIEFFIDAKGKFVERLDENKHLLGFENGAPSRVLLRQEQFQDLPLRGLRDPDPQGVRQAAQHLAPPNAP